MITSNTKNLEKHLEYYRSIIEENKECEIEHSSYNFNSKFSLKDGLIKFSISDNNLINFNDINIKCENTSNKYNSTSFIKTILLLVEKAD